MIKLFTAALLMCFALPSYGLFNWQRPEKHAGAATYGSSAYMETAVASKPRISYAQYVASQQSKQQEHTLGRACQWRIEQSKKPGARPLGDSLGYILQRLQREEVGTKVLPALKPQDLVDHGRARIAEGVVPATVQQDITALRSTVRDYVEMNDLPASWLEVFKKALRTLQKEQLVGKSSPRDRLPLEVEREILAAHFAKQNAHPRCKTDMVLVTEALLLTTRRISELCRIERQHVNVEKKTCWVYDLKNSKGKGYHGEFALIEGAWELFEKRLAVIGPEPTARLFPFVAKTCSQRYTIAKKKLRAKYPELFANLRMHDTRAMGATRLLKKGYTVTQVQKGVTLHLDDRVLVRRYARLTAVDLHQGPAGAPIEARGQWPHN